MRLFSFIVLVFTCFLFNQTHAQDTLKVKSLEAVIESSLSSFRKQINNEQAIIYNIVEVNFDTNKINFTKNDFVIENGINSQRIDYRTDNFVLKFVISMENERTFVKVIQFRLKKQSNKVIEFINLLSGSDYEIIR